MGVFSGLVFRFQRFNIVIVRESGDPVTM